MFRFVYYSDLQMHDWQTSTNPEFWKLGLDCIDRVYTIAERTDANLVIFGGDLFQNKRTLRADIASATYARLQRYIRRYPDMMHWFVAGNHDWYRGACTLSGIHQDVKRGNHVRIITKPTFIRNNNTPSFYLVPFGHWKEDDFPSQELDEWLVSVFHTPFHGARMTPTGILDTAKESEFYTELIHQSELALCGHYHDPQKIGLMTCVGAPMYFSWSDVDAQPGRGCILAHMGKQTNLDRYDFSMPRFVTKATDATSDHDIVRYVVQPEKETKKTALRTGTTTIALSDMKVALREYVQHIDPKDIPEAERAAVLALGLEIHATCSR